MRSGSTLLADILTNTKIAGNVDEYLRESLENCNKFDNEHYPKYILNNLSFNASENGVSGVKMMWENFEYLIQKLHKYYCDLNLSDYELLNKVFPNVKFIYINRKSKLRQAVSLDKAIQTSTWYIKREKSNRIKIKRYIMSPKFITKAIENLRKQDQNWENFFMINNIKPFRIVYEDFHNNYENIICNCIIYLDLDNNKFSLNPPTIQKQSGFLTNLWFVYYYLYTFLDYIIPNTFEKLRKVIKKFKY